MIFYIFKRDSVYVLYIVMDFHPLVTVCVSIVITDAYRFECCNYN